KNPISNFRLSALHRVHRLSLETGNKFHSFNLVPRKSTGKITKDLGPYPQSMFSGPGKMGRGGGGVVRKRNIRAPPISRASRPSMGGVPRGRSGAPPAAASSPSTSSMQVDESFRLVRENPLKFGMAIKLAPDLVEEIKRVEAEGGGARIKFDVNANNPSGNVIHVGDKIFRFTWSREPGDLCDIYEERQNGEDGNGFLVESGGTWRKLNVERELDESTKNHVKWRSEEAERKHKSRKAIVLDHQNPSMKNQVKALAAAESNPWRNSKNRKEPPFKKAKLNPPSGGPPKSTNKSTVLKTTVSKGKISSGSPVSSQPEQLGGPAFPAGGGNHVNGRVDITDAALTQNTNIIASSGKEMSCKWPHSIIRGKSKHSRNTEAKPADLKSLVISLLQENQPKGMSLKALEKAIGEVMPNSALQIDPILKKVAVFQSPGRYLLKQGPEKESVKKPPSESGSFPATYRHQLDPMATSANNEQENGKLNSTSPPLTIDKPTDKTDTLPRQQLSDGKAAAAENSSSDSSSGSSSDSDSSDSGSSSRSHSSQLASDEDINIMSDDELARPEPYGPHRDANCASPKRFVSGKNSSHPVAGTISSLFGDSPNENSSPDRPSQSPSQRPVVDIVAQSSEGNKSRFADAGPGQARSSEGDKSRFADAGPGQAQSLEGDKSRFADAGPGQAQSSEGHGDVTRRLPVSATEQQQKKHDPVRGVGPVQTKVSKKQKSNVNGNLNGRQADASLRGINDSGRKMKESSRDVDILYAKYDKKEPELNGPIKDVSQYKEYVKEYQEKYESYRSLNKILEDYRDEFTKYGKDLETYKGRDMKRYHEILKQMRLSFHQCGEVLNACSARCPIYDIIRKHKRQKKIFIVLYEELKHLKQMIKDYTVSYK
ncbi:dentin sialophospho protein, partial [Striga asiatica]